MQAQKTDFNAMISNANLVLVIDKPKTAKTVSAEVLRQMIQKIHPAVSNDARSKK